MTRDVIAELKALRLHGMAGTWADLIEQNNAELEPSRWLVEQMLSAETTERATRSVSHQMNAAKFPVHRDLAGFDFEVSPVDRKLVLQLAEMDFTDAAHNVVLVGGPGTGKSHLATAIGVAGIAQHGKRVRFYLTVDLVNALEQEKAQARPGASPAACCVWMRSCSTRWGICPSARQAGRCCSICCPSSMSTPAWW
jgi:DNA replication protein DnaC